MSVLRALLHTLRVSLRSRAALQLELLALRHQLAVLERTRPRRLRLDRVDRALWCGLAQGWAAWRTSLMIVQPETVLAWHRHGFRLFWRWKSRHRGGRPGISADIRNVIRTMSQANSLWGAPRIHGELLKLGITVSQSTVAKHMVRRQRPSSPTWRSFLCNQVDQVAAADFVVVRTATYRLLFVLVVIAHQRRRILHIGVTAHPTAAWTAPQLREAFPEQTVPRYLLHDRDTAFADVTRTAATMGIQDVQTAARSPWQNAYAERLIGSIRRECLDHVIVLSERGLRRILAQYVAYYQETRTHLSLAKDSPQARAVASRETGPIVATPQVGGLHHRYDRRAA